MEGKWGGTGGWKERKIRKVRYGLLFIPKQAARIDGKSLEAVLRWKVLAVQQNQSAVDTLLHYTRKQTGTLRVFNWNLICCGSLIAAYESFYDCHNID